MKRRIRVMLTLLLTALIGLFSVKTLSYLLHDHWNNQEQLRLADGTTLEVRHQGSKWHYFSGGHAFGFGGGDRRERLKFERHGSQIIWEGLYEPVAVQFDGEVPVVLVFDRESQHSQWGLRYYRKTDGWSELPLSSLPRRIALLNMWRHDPDQVAGCDPNDARFQGSLTAQLWLCIAMGKHYQEIRHLNATADFLKEFKQSMLR
jgi:hypothetical protein